MSLGLRFQESGQRYLLTVVSRPALDFFPVALVVYEVLLFSDPELTLKGETTLQTLKPSSCRGKGGDGGGGHKTMGGPSFYFGSSGSARVWAFYLQVPHDMISHCDILTNHETTLEKKRVRRIAGP